VTNVEGTKLGSVGSGTSPDVGKNEKSPGQTLGGKLGAKRVGISRKMVGIVKLPRGGGKITKNGAIMGRGKPPVNWRLTGTPRGRGVGKCPRSESNPFLKGEIKGGRRAVITS